ncbi:MAG: DUF4062 domain-containing protein [Pseudomonadota bacterium]
MSDFPMPRVMISSPVKGLEGVRARAHAVCEALGLPIVSMEENKAVAQSALKYSIDLVESSDVFVGIAGTSAGSRPSADEHHYSRMEYERAKLSQLPRLLFLLEAPESPATSAVGEDMRKLLLNDKDAVSSFFEDEDEFERSLRTSLEDFLKVWRENRGLTPGHAELTVERSVVEQGESINLELKAPDVLREAMSVRLGARIIELDDSGVASIEVRDVAEHTLELLFQPGDEDEPKVIQQSTITVVQKWGSLPTIALGGAFVAFATWLLLGFSHPVVVDVPIDYQPLNFKDDWLGHVLTSGALVCALVLGVVSGRARRELGRVAQHADQVWGSLRLWVVLGLMAVLGLAAYLNARFVIEHEDRIWWSEELGEWAVWTISLVFFLLALGPMLALIARLGLSVIAGMRSAQAVLTYDPCDSDGHFGLAWLGNTLLSFLAIASVPLGVAIAIQFHLHDKAGLGVPIAVILGFLTIGAVVYPMAQAYTNLSQARFGAKSAEQRRLEKLRAQPESALLESERQERRAQIERIESRVEAIERASAIVAGWKGAVAVAITGFCLLLPFALFVFVL